MRLVMTPCHNTQGLGAAVQFARIHRIGHGLGKRKQTFLEIKIASQFTDGSFIKQEALPGSIRDICLIVQQALTATSEHNTGFGAAASLPFGIRQMCNLCKAHLSINLGQSEEKQHALLVVSITLCCT